MSSSHQRPRPCNDRTAARKWAVRYRPDKARLADPRLLEPSGIAVVAASAAAVVARAVAAAVGAPATEVREVLAAAIASERGRGGP